MPWETKFDINTALDKATELFWAKGFKATSLSDLLSAMEINKGSFYNTFGSKKSLFFQTLQKYDIEHRNQILRDLRSLDNPIESITKLFDLIVEQSNCDADKKGCFIINTAIDLPNHDLNTQSMVKSGLKEVEAFFKEQVEAGIESGAIPKTLNVNDTAKSLLTLAAGCRVLSRGVFEESDMKAIRRQVRTIVN